MTHPLAEIVTELRRHEVSGPGLDRDYIARWVAELDLETLWHRANAEAERT